MTRLDGTTLYRIALGDDKRPDPWQLALATDAWPRVLVAPTGSGKTAAVTLGWAAHRLRSPDTTPRRLVWCLPMRTLVEQTAQAVQGWFGRLAAEDGRLARLSYAARTLARSPVAPASPQKPDPDDVEPPRRAIRRKAPDGLFDTDPDLTGFDVDASPYVPDADDADIHVSWREDPSSPHGPWSWAGRDPGSRSPQLVREDRRREASGSLTTCRVLDPRRGGSHATARGKAMPLW